MTFSSTSSCTSFRCSILSTQRDLIYKEAPQKHLWIHTCMTRWLWPSKKKANARLPPGDPSVWAAGLWWLFLQRQMWGLLMFTPTMQNIFRLELSKETSSETLWHSRGYERAISQATWEAEIALNSLNPLKLQGMHSQQSILELQSLMGRPASSNRWTSTMIPNQRVYS